jgi:hypothetical protein
MMAALAITQNFQQENNVGAALVLLRIIGTCITMNVITGIAREKSQVLRFLILTKNSFLSKEETNL